MIEELAKRAWESRMTNEPWEGALEGTRGTYRRIVTSIIKRLAPGIRSSLHFAGWSGRADGYEGCHCQSCRDLDSLVKLLLEVEQLDVNTYKPQRTPFEVTNDNHPRNSP